MGAIMIIIALIHGAIAIVKLCSRRQVWKSERYELPRHLAICENSAAAHEALGQHVSDNSPAPGSGRKLSPSVSETITSVNANERGSLKPKYARSQQQTAPMPAERVSRSRDIIPL
ncbi:hypothetical protein F5Y09DRAFT_305700, partial [Xylaria sp. FL1042]